MINIIEVNNIYLHAYHGCLEEEGLIGGKYKINLKLTLNFIEAAKTDDLTKTIDYVSVNKIVVEEMSIRSKLIEHVGYRILERCKKEFSQLKEIEVEIIKISPPINGDVESVAVILKKSLNDF